MDFRRMSMATSKYHFFRIVNLYSKQDTNTRGRTMNSNLYDKLLNYVKSDYYGFHMPGHKRNTDIAYMENPFAFDITEIEGFDNLHNATEIIKKEMDYAAKIYGSERTYFLVNGSSCGNLSAISSVAKAGDKIIIARNSHKSVYNAVELLRLKVDYLYPEMVEAQDIFGGYSLEETKKVLDNNREAKAIVITSPTYEGIVSDVEGICKIAHEYGIPVIVDAAHGAHFILSEDFPKTALECGADIVIESLHKTLPSLTQTAVLHFNSNIANRERLEKYLAVYQSSSPSYVLMASISNCLHFIEKDGKEKAEWLAVRIKEFKKIMRNLQHIRIFDNEVAGQFDFDISKLVIVIKDGIISGKKLKDILNEKYHLEMEMAAGNYVIAMTSIFDKEEGFSRLQEALIEIDKMLDEGNIESANQENQNVALKDKLVYSIRNEKACEIFEAEDYAKKIDVETKYTYLYPPGIPIVVPGEIISDEVRKTLEIYRCAGYEVIVD